MWWASPGVRPRRASSRTKPDERRLGAAQGGQRAGRDGRRQQVAVDVGGVGVRDDDVGRQPFAAREPDAGDAPPRAVEEDPGDGLAGADLRAPVDGPRVHGVAEPPQTALDVPGAEGLLDVRHGRERGGGPARVRAGVGGVPVEAGPLVRVAQVPPPEPAQRVPRGDGAQVAQPASPAGPGSGARPAGPRGRSRGSRPRSPRRARRTPSSRRRRRPRARRPRPAAMRERGAVRQVELRAVGEPVVADRVDGHERHLGLQRPTGGEEQVAVDGGQREQARPGVEHEAVAGQHAQLAADDRAPARTP